MSASPSDLRALYERLGPEGYQRAMRHACWRAGDLSHVLHGGQVQAREMVMRVHKRAVDEGLAKRALLNIARRWGKTFFFIVWCLEIMLRKPGARIPYAARSEVSVREFVEPILRELAAQAPPDLAPREYKGEWIIPEGPGRPKTSRLIVKGCEDRAKADRLRGPAADAFVIDEAGFIPVLGYVVRDVASAQLMTTDGMMLVGSSAPEEPEHEFWVLADEAQERGAFMHATVYDNPLLTPKQIASFAAEVGGEDTLAWQREGLSRRVVDVERAVFPEWAEAELLHITKPDEAAPVVGEVERPEHFDTYVVGDLGFADQTFVLLGYYHFPLALLVIEGEVVCQRQASDVIEAWTSAKYAQLYGVKKPLVRALEGDAITVASIAKEERIARGEARRGEPDEADESDSSRWNQIVSRDFDGAVNAARLRIKRRGVLVHPRCEQLIAHLRGAVWNRARTEFDRVKRDGKVIHHYDGAAAFVYLNRRLQVNKNPFPRLPPGVHYHTHHIPPGLMGDPRIDKLKRAFAGRRERR